MNALDHRIEDFLIKALARHVERPTILALFKEQFGRYPTEDEYAKCNLGEFIGDKRAVFDPNNSRMRKFLKERKLYDEGIKNIPIHNPRWRMDKLNMIYHQLEPMALETGNWGNCVDILKAAAKEAMEGYKPNTAITVDNRTVNMNMNMSNEELSKEVNRVMEELFEGMGIKLPDLPIIRSGDNVIEHDPE